MKKTLITLVTMFLIATSGFSSETVKPEVLSAFKANFRNVQEVNWEEGSNYYKATFISNGSTSYAFYNTKGDLLNLTRHLVSTNLPLKLNKMLKAKYKGYWISDLFEFSNETGTHYYIVLKNANKKILLESGKRGSWKLYH